ncbi:hypothetical protein SAMN05216420_10449 [Nitrosospira sp. Nl5]|nr:hypothetical protein SAMN05216420_10449 [Nitrosospira sp. Nl5]
MVESRVTALDPRAKAHFDDIEDNANSGGSQCGMLLGYLIMTRTLPLVLIT